MSDQRRKVIPAQLQFLAIYNPSLGTTDDTLDNQIVYYYPSIKQNGHKRKGFTDTKEAHAFAKEQKNEQLRQIGLAQGMVEFGRSFSEGESVDTIETEKSRIILHELEYGWWILASINLTILPGTTKTPATKGKPAEEQETIEYSSREVKPAILLLADLLRAHSIFLLHHASSLSALFVRTRSSKFVSILGRYWDTYISTWNVLMHGNPANNLYGGIKVAACGELGVGVGEEDRGSGEREVLEGFVGQMEGLVDVIVSRFGDAQSDFKDDTSKGLSEQRSKQSAPWLGSGNEPATEDGAIFLGTRALSRKSLRDVSHWVEDLYKWGPYAYGVVDNPSSTRRAKKTNKPRPRKDQTIGNAKNTAQPTSNLSKEIPIHDGPHDGPRPNRSSSISTVEHRAVVEEDSRSDRPKSKPKPPRPVFRSSHTSHTSTEGTDGTDGESMSSTFAQYLKFGYGTHWSLGGTTAKEEQSKPSSGLATPISSINGTTDTTGRSTSIPEYDDSKGHYLVGLMGNIEGEIDISITPNAEDEEFEGLNDRLVLRTLTVELEREEDARQEADISIDHSDFGSSFRYKSGSERTGNSNVSFKSQDRNKTKKLRVVVYANRPFIFIFLFELRTDSLALGHLYQSLHKQLQSLIKPLLKSTSFRAPRPEIPVSPLAHTSNPPAPIYDLLWDPKTLTLNSNIPNIPDPQQVQTQEEADRLPWSRIEALNTHLQILHTYIATTADKNSLERTAKTSRGYWILWTRIPSSPPGTPPPNPKVKIPTPILENPAEIQTSCTFTSETSGQGRIDKDEKSQGGGSTTKTGISGPAHPFLDDDDDGREGEGGGKSQDKEIFLIRRASDYVESGQRRASGYGYGYAYAGGWMAGAGGGGGGGGENAGWGATGLGLDTKRYIEGLLSLNR